MKDFIRDDGKVRECTSNIAKMNIFEWMYYRRSLFWMKIHDTAEQLYKGSPMLVCGVINLIVIIAFPITYSISAYKGIREAKKEMELHEKYKSKPL